LQEEYLVSLGTDGCVLIWELATKHCIFSKKVFEGDSTYNLQPGIPKAAWSPDGSVLALPGSRHPQLLERGTWRVVDSSASRLAHTAEISVLAWAPDGHLLASAGEDRRLVIWAVPQCGGPALLPAQIYMDKESVNEGIVGASRSRALRQIQWIEMRQLAVLDCMGFFGIKNVPEDAISTLLSSSVQVISELKGSKRDAATKDAAPGESRRRTQTPELERHEEKERASSNKNVETPEKRSFSLHRDKHIESTHEGGEGFEEEESAPDDEPGVLDYDHIKEERETIPPYSHLQGPFLPSSSPVDALKRFLVWNLVGNIVSQNLGDHNVIEIEFADVSRRPIRFTDHYRFNMGSMAEEGAIFASATLDEINPDKGDKQVENKDEERSTVFFRPFANYSAKNQWLYTLPKKEGALCVAVGARWTAVATTRQWVRLFTFSGLQEGVLAMPGPVVTMVGQGELLAVFYHGGIPLINHSTGSASQSLHYQLLDIRRTVVVSQGPVCLSPDSLLIWAGFDNSDMLHIMDSEGLLSSLVRGFSWHWTPILESSRLRRNKMDSFWPVGVFNGSLMCSLLRGGEEHPPTNPKPLVSSLPFKPPFVMSNNDHALLKLEEVRFLSKTFLCQKLYEQEVLAFESLEDHDLEADILRNQASYDAHLVKMIQQAGAAENGERMLELAETLTLPKSLTLAVRIADHYSLPQVAARISDLVATRFPPIADIHLSNEETENQDPRGFKDSPLSSRTSMLTNEHDLNNDDINLPERAERTDMSADHRDPLFSPARPRASQVSRIGNSSTSFVGRCDAESGTSRNPFAMKDAEGKKPAEKRSCSIAESLAPLMSPSPKKPVLSKSSTFVSEIRSKKKHDRRA